MLLLKDQNVQSLSQRLYLDSFQTCYYYYYFTLVCVSCALPHPHARVAVAEAMWHSTIMGHNNNPTRLYHLRFFTPPLVLVTTLSVVPSDARLVV